MREDNCHKFIYGTKTKQRRQFRLSAISGMVNSQSVIIRDFNQKQKKERTSQIKKMNPPLPEEND